MEIKDIVEKVIDEAWEWMQETFIWIEERWEDIKLPVYLSLGCLVIELITIMAYLTSKFLFHNTIFEQIAERINGPILFACDMILLVSIIYILWKLFLENYF
jgi:hypothetical protein